MTKILALDAGLTCGLAFVEGGMPPNTSSHKIAGNSSDQLGLACHKFGHLVRQQIDTYKPDGLVLCTPFISMNHGIAPIKLLFGMFGMAHAVCHSMQMPIWEVSEQAVRRHFKIATPKIKNAEKRRRALKASIVKRCEELGWYVSTDHAADALLAAAYKFDEINPKFAHKSTPLFKAA